MPPVEEAAKFLARYTADTLVRLNPRVRRGPYGASRSRSFTPTRGRWSSPIPAHGIITSPPYPGLIDYHEQHRYAYELLGLEDRREVELGAAARGTSRAAVEEYVAGISQVLRACTETLTPDAPVILVVNDRRDLYPEILRRSGLRLEDRLERHVNRRTGRRAGEYFESVLIATTSVA